MIRNFHRKNKILKQYLKKTINLTLADTLVKISDRLPYNQTEYIDTNINMDL